VIKLPLSELATELGPSIANSLDRLYAARTSEYSCVSFVGSKVFVNAGDKQAEVANTSVIQLTYDYCKE
jgi:hypothetical protein